MYSRSNIVADKYKLSVRECDPVDGHLASSDNFIKQFPGTRFLARVFSLGENKSWETVLITASDGTSSVANSLRRR